MAVSNSKVTLRRAHALTSRCKLSHTLVSPWDGEQPLDSTLEKPCLSTSDFSIEGRADSMATDLTMCCPQIRASWGMHHDSVLPTSTHSWQCSFPCQGGRPDPLHCCVVQPTEANPPPPPQLTAFLLPGWMHQDHPQCRVWALNQTRTTQCLFLGNWESAWLKGSLPLSAFASISQLLISASVPSRVSVTPPHPSNDHCQSFAFGDGPKPGLSSSWGEPSEGLPLPCCVYLHINQCFPKKLNCLHLHRSRARQSEEITHW